MTPLVFFGIFVVGVIVFAVVIWLVTRETGTKVRIPSMSFRPVAAGPLRRFRVKGIDVGTREPAEFSEFEAKDRDDVLVRLSGAGIEVRSIEEVPWVDLKAETRAADVAAVGQDRTLAADAQAAVWNGIKAAGRAIAQDNATRHEIAERERAARKVENDWHQAPRQRVLADLSFSSQINIAVGVFLGIVAAAIFLSMCGGVLGLFAGAAALGR